MEYIEVTGKSVEEAITNACTKLGIPSDKLDYEVIDLSLIHISEPTRP